MKFFFLTIAIFAASYGCFSQELSEQEIIKLKLEALEGKYAHEADIFEIPIIKKRFEKLLNENVFKDVKECMMVTPPYKISNGFFHFSGHSKLSYNGCSIVIDLKQNLFHVKIFYEETGEEKVFSDDMGAYRKLPGNLIE